MNINDDMNLKNKKCDVNKNQANRPHTAIIENQYQNTNHIDTCRNNFNTRKIDNKIYNITNY